MAHMHPARDLPSKKPSHTQRTLLSTVSPVSPNTDANVHLEIANAGMRDLLTGNLVLYTANAIMMATMSA